MTDQAIRLDQNDIGRSERAAAKAEGAGASIGKAAADAGRLATQIISKLGRLAARSEAFLEGTEFAPVARVGADIALAGVAGARAGAALGSLIPVVGGTVGFLAGGALGAGLGTQIEAGRRDGNRRALAVGNEAFRREEALRTIREDAEEREKLREAAEKETAPFMMDLGGGDPARLAAIRRVFRRAR